MTSVDGKQLIWDGDVTISDLAIPVWGRILAARLRHVDGVQAHHRPTSREECHAVDGLLLGDVSETSFHVVVLVNDGALLRTSKALVHLRIQIQETVDGGARVWDVKVLGHIEGAERPNARAA